MAQRFYPVPQGAVVTSGFGPRWGGFHYGVDFGREGGSANMPVFAAQAGTVVYAGAATGFGGPDPAGWVVVDHPTEAGSGTTVYGHVVREVAVGEHVAAGQRIAHVNPNPDTNGGVAPHMHFEVHPWAWQAGSQIDPLPWLGDSPRPGGAYPQGMSETIFGVDVSEFQDGMPLTQAAAEGIQFAIVRTTDGTYKDRVYRSHVDDGRNAGLVLSAYHFLRNPSEGTSVAEQVRASLEVMGDHHRLPVWLDVETPAGLHVNHIRQAKAAYEAAGVRVIGAYSYVPYWEGRIQPGEPDSHEFGAFWVAAYGANSHGTPAQLYKGNAHRQWSYPLGNQLPVIWQFGSNGRVAGFTVDVNAFRGSKDQIRALFEGSAPAPAPVVPEVVAPAPKADPDPVPAPENTVMGCNCPEDVCLCRRCKDAPVVESAPAAYTESASSKPESLGKVAPMADSWMTSKQFWADTLERAIRTAAQAGLAVVSVPAAGEVADIPLHLPWEAMIYTVVTATLVSILTSLTGRGVGDHSTASLTRGTPQPGEA